MKTKIFTFIFTLILFCSCYGPSIVYNTERVATVEDIRTNITNNSSKYIVKAWSYNPSFKEYKIYTDSLYHIGDRIAIKGQK